MKICYSANYNIDLGFLKFLHPFDGKKFQRVYDELNKDSKMDFISPQAMVSDQLITEFVNALIKRFLVNKVAVLRALEVPKLPFISFKFLDQKVLQPMKWGVAGTIISAKEALVSGLCWNLSGGYHHASQHSIEGFCIYNDIGICYQELLKESIFTDEDKILIIDTDAHHGNGNARTFKENKNVEILDVFNESIYPKTYSSRSRVDFPVPLNPGTLGKEYLEKYSAMLKTVSSNYKLAFVVAGTDVLATDKLGGFKLTEDDVVEREKMTIRFLKEKNIPAVVLSGGGYSKDSAPCIAKAIIECSKEFG
ncbi:MAG: histone deacetylase family protein [Cellvibrionaceae bacterium]